MDEGHEMAHSGPPRLVDGPGFCNPGGGNCVCQPSQLVRVKIAALERHLWDLPFFMSFCNRVPVEEGG